MQRSAALDSRMGTAYGIYPCGSALVMANWRGDVFGEVVDFLLGGGGEEELQGTAAEAFSQTTRVPNGPVICVIYYILSSGGFAVPCFRPS